MRACGAMVVGLWLAGRALAGAAESPDLVGRWTNATGSVGFLGDGVGWRVAGERAAFRYALAGPGHVHLDFGGGSNVTFAAIVRGDALDLAAAGATATYTRAFSTWTACQTNLLSLEAAKAVFLRDDPGALRVSVGELVPAYLRALPACDGPGHYTLGPFPGKPACSAHGTVSE